jgi:hypothetical protein
LPTPLLFEYRVFELRVTRAISGYSLVDVERLIATRRRMTANKFAVFLAKG